MQPRGITRWTAAAVLVLCLSPSAGARQDDLGALAAALLAVPAADRPALLERRAVTPTPPLVEALVTTGGRRAAAGDLDGAFDAYDYALALAKRLGDRSHTAAALLGLGQVYGRRADYDRARALTSEALDAATALADDRLVASAVNNLGILFRLQGDYDQARVMYRRVLAMADAAHRDDQIARALGNLGVVETYQGMYDAAVADLQQSLDIGTRLKSDQIVLNATLNLGNVYYYQNNCTLALDLYGRVLADGERSGNAASVQSSLNNIAACERLLGSLDRSLAHMQRSLDLAIERRLPAEIARCQFGIAEVYLHQRRWTDALEELSTSLETREAIGDRLGIAETLVSRAQALAGLGRLPEALDSAGRGAALADEIDLPDVAAGARALQGKLLVRMHRASDAETALRDAIALVEATRTRVAGTAVDRARYLAVSVEPYGELASLLAADGRALESLQVAEQAHARALGEVLAGHDAEDVLTPEERDRQRALQRRLGTLNRQMEALPATTASASRATELAAARREARLALDRFATTLYAAHPELRLRYGAPPPLTTGTLARRLDPATAIVEFTTGPDATLMLIATAGPGGPTVRAHTIAIGARDLEKRVSAFNAAIARRDLRVAAEARALGALLVDPALATGRTRLIIVPDGVLWTLPFPALRTARDRYVVEDHVVSYAPSIVALQLLGDRRGAAAPGGFVGVADPDPSHPLAESRRQVEQLAADPAWHGRALTGSAATEAAVRRAIASASIVHVASHGVFEDASPLYSHIVLAPGDGRDTSNDGRLEAWELMRLPLRASLVVFAACESGRGDVRGGEGVIGLSWAALAAGSPAAVVSLWRVDEAATGAWMSAFYARWRSAGASGAAAEAARALLASNRFGHPFYWAPFVVIGDPGRTPTARSSQPRRDAPAPAPMDWPRWQ
jgi:tetratricopeptide (TPR) repeat protein